MTQMKTLKEANKTLTEKINKAHFIALNQKEDKYKEKEGSKGPKDNFGSTSEHKYQKPHKGVYTMSTKKPLQRSLNNHCPFQYLKVTTDLTFHDFGSRRTSISSGGEGFVLEEDKIFKLLSVSAERKSQMIEEMMECYTRGGVYALVCGYACILMPGEYQVLDYTPNRLCGELI